MILHENCLPADDSHEISCLMCDFEKVAKFGRLLQIIDGAFRVNWVEIMLINNALIKTSP